MLHRAKLTEVFCACLGLEYTQMKNSIGYNHGKRFVDIYLSIELQVFTNILLTFLNRRQNCYFGHFGRFSFHKNLYFAYTLGRMAEFNYARALSMIIFTMIVGHQKPFFTR